MNTSQETSPAREDAAHKAADLVRRLAEILTPLLRLITINCPIIGALFQPLHGRIVRAHQRFARLLTSLAAGTYPAPRIQQPKRPGGPRGVYIPQTKAWLIIKFGYHAAGRAYQLNAVLHAPETQALLAAAPPHAQAAAARTLRPLCRMLGIELPPVLQPPPRAPAAPKPKPPRAPRLPRLTARDIYPWRTPRPNTFIQVTKKRPKSG